MTNTHTVEPIDFTHLTWTLSRSSTGTAGSFLKSYEEKDGQKVYYKMSNYDSVRGVIGHESINEIVAQNIADLFNIQHLAYDLVYCTVQVADRIFETWVTRSRDFKNPGESKMTFETYYDNLTTAYLFSFPVIKMAIKCWNSIN